jgi:bifunctional N-acetylglucosamine-1-phosphate-uridyltransferase/glucosamine-1-phosphate-acetyltransferase GlmU-like protein
MIKKTFLELILSQLQTITTANGYLTDIGLDAAYARDINQEWDTEGVTFRDFNCNITENNTFHEYDVEIEIEAITFADNLIEAGCNLEEDLIKLVSKNLNWTKVDAMITAFVPSGSIVKSFQTAGRSAVSVILNLAVQYRIPKWSVG